MNLTCTHDGEWFFVSHKARTLAVYPRNDKYCIGENTAPSEFCDIDGLCDFENPQAAIDHAEWMLAALACGIVPRRYS